MYTSIVAQLFAKGASVNFLEMQTNIYFSFSMSEQWQIQKMYPKRTTFFTTGSDMLGTVRLCSKVKIDCKCCKDAENLSQFQKGI